MITAKVNLQDNTASSVLLKLFRAYCSQRCQPPVLFRTKTTQKRSTHGATTNLTSVRNTPDGDCTFTEEEEEEEETSPNYAPTMQIFKSYLKYV